MATATNNRTEGRKRPIRNLFDDLSVAQVLAGALAAVTSMLLASQIGIYGSVIGVGVGSVISAVASQVYKKFLSASADRIRAAGGRGGDSPASEEREEQPVRPSADAASSLLSPSSSSVGIQCLAPSAETALLPTVASADTVVIAPVPQTSGGDGRPSKGAMLNAAAESQLYADTDRVRAHAARLRKERTKQRVLMVSVVSALVAVVACAAVITLVTQGEGVGAKPQHFVSAGQNAAVQGDESVEGPSSGSASDSQGESGSMQDSSSSSGSENPSQGSSGSPSEGGSSGSQGSASSEGSGQESSGDSGPTGESGSSEGSGAGGSTDQGSEGESSSGPGSTGSDAGGSTGSSSGSDSSGSGSQGSVSSGSGGNAGQNAGSKALSALDGGALPVR